MNHHINMPFVEKMIEAKRLEKEAMMMLLPEKMRGHLDIIGKEIKGMLMEVIIDQFSDSKTEATACKEEPNKKVKKVDIG